MVTMEQTLKSFGYARLVGLRQETLEGIRKAIRSGLPFETIDKFRALTGLQNAEIMGVLRMKPATYARRKKAGVLSQEESERMLRAARIFSMVMELYGGNRQAAQAYIKYPSSDLDGETPLKMMSEDDEGARQVEEQLFARLRGDVIT